MSPTTDWPPFYKKKKRKRDSELLANLVNAAEIARRAGVGRPAVANWSARGVGFPEPVVRLLYDWREVEAWLRATARYPRAKPEEVAPARTIDESITYALDHLAPRPWRP